MWVGASLSNFRGLSFRQAVKIYLDLSNKYNLNAVEVWFEKCGDRPSIWSWEIDEVVKKFLINFEVFGFHLPFIYLNPISQNPRIKKESIKQLKESIVCAANLNANYTVMHARGEVIGLTQEEKLERWVEVIEDLADLAKEHSILLTLENADFFQDISLLIKIVKKINSKWLKITFDIGHAHIRRVPPLNTYPVKDLFLRALDLFLPLYFIKKNMPFEAYGSIKKFVVSEWDLISVVHVHDYNGRRDHLPIGTGKIDFSFFSELKSRFKGPYIIEAVFKDYYKDFRKNYTNVRRLLEI